MLVTNGSNLIIFGVKGWHGLSRKRREAEHEALSTDGFSFLPTKRKYKTLVLLLLLLLLKQGGLGSLLVCESVRCQMSHVSLRPVILPFRPAQMD